jgi:Mycothiol maleylpyruvate isomerase N-terminal domain
MTSSQESPALEGEALMAALAEVAPSTPTACVGWTAHNISAHFAAGTKEIADLIESKVHHHRQRPTLGFDEREAPFLAMEGDDLSRALAVQAERMQVAVAALADTDDPSFLFTGRNFTIGQLATHNRSEAALHRWDILGDDDLSEQLLTQPDLTRHAVDVLNTLPVLYEAPEWRAKHAGVTQGLRIVLRSPHTADVVYEHTPTGARFEIVDDGSAIGDAVVATDVANRYLTIWGRRSAVRPLTVDTDTVSSDVVGAVLWGAGMPWAANRQRPMSGATMKHQGRQSH